MSTSAASEDPRARDVVVTDRELIVTLGDGRRIATPLSWFPRLDSADPEQRANWSLIGDGEGIRWEEVDEDLSVAGLLEGTRR